ncbi:MAG: cytochrome c3 family protein [Desulfobacterales bacterium]
MIRNAIRVTLISSCLLLYAATPAAGQDDVLIESPAFSHRNRPPVVFPHEAHEYAGIDNCSTCHHVFVDGEKVEDESSEDQYCGDCHGLEAGNGKPGLRRAFHDMCMECHFAMEEGPVMCGDCHVRGVDY